MDLIKTLLVYMMMVVSASTDAAPAVTPPPDAFQPTATPYVTMAPTAVPTPVPTATPVPYTTLYVNDRGEAVKKLQRRLAELGYLTGKIDGIYGQQTKKAVERFQYYNGLTVDGIAGKVTQTLLFESRSVVTAPPEITVGPSPTPAVPASVNVPVYYVDQNGRLLTQLTMTCYGTTTIYANSNNVSADYALESSGAVVVTIKNGVASPSSVTFRYRQKVTPSPAPSTVTIPVYYLTEQGSVLYQTSATLTRGYTSNVLVSTNLVSSDYELISNGRVPVTVNAQGVASPSSVVFTFRRKATPVPTQAPTPVPTHQEVMIYYVTEDDVLITQEVRILPVNQVSVVAPNPALEPLGCTLISTPTVTVSITAQGVQRPERIAFRYKPIPQATATPAPTWIPVVAVSRAPVIIPQETPVPAPVLEQVGGALLINGQEHPIAWYMNEKQEIFVSLTLLAEAAGWQLVPPQAEPFMIGDYEVTAHFDENSLYALTVNQEDQQELACFWQGDLFISHLFLEKLAIQMLPGENVLEIILAE